MTPDAPLFFPVGPDYWFTHSWLGALVADLPLALGLLLLWRVVLRAAVPQLTPRWLSERWPATWSAGPKASWRELWGEPGQHVRSSLLLVASLALGIATHLLWDDFTHPGRWGSTLVPALDRPFGPFLVADWAHYVSSVLGLTIIAVWGIRWLRSRMPRPVHLAVPAPLPAFVWVAVPISLALASVVVLLVYGWPHDPVAARVLAERAGKGGAALILVSFGISALLLALLAGVRKQRHARDASKFGRPPKPT